MSKVSESVARNYYGPARVTKVDDKCYMTVAYHDVDDDGDGVWHPISKKFYDAFVAEFGFSKETIEDDMYICKS